MTVTYVTPAEATVKVGDYFYADWGYDQTNITFFKVVGLTPKGVKVQEWTSGIVSTDGYSDMVVPGPGPRTGVWVNGTDGPTYDHDAPYPIRTKRIQMWGERAVANWTTFASMYHWDGTPKRQTNPMYGR